PTAVSRAAGMALTKILAGEGAPYNVLVNALLVGIIVSEQWERRHANEGSNTSFAEFVARMGESVPLKRMGKAEEFANLACFLASDAASYVTGTAINVDGGRSPVV
ncbi:MAG TPA: SDR family oxidoreductase, partial [Acetobacteraceae bacterium]|nr:SDR family oxidoreductase [Acetobacteraceae bacterium]